MLHCSTGLGRLFSSTVGLGLELGLGLEPRSKYLVELLLPCFPCFEVLQVKAHNDACFPGTNVLRSHFARKHLHPALFAGLPPALAVSAELRTNIHHYISHHTGTQTQLLIQRESYKSDDLDSFFELQ